MTRAAMGSMCAEPDLFTVLHPPCADCTHLADALPSGVRYCQARMMWRWASERVACSSRRPLDEWSMA